MGRLRFAHIRRLRGLVPALLVPLMLAALLAPAVLPLCAANAAFKPPQCRGAGMPADAPLFYLELMSYDDAQKARELESLKYDEERKERESGRKAKKDASGQSAEAARLAASIRSPSRAVSRRPGCSWTTVLLSSTSSLPKPATSTA
jgi:hypothetical protein